MVKEQDAPCSPTPIFKLRCDVGIGFFVNLSLASHRLSPVTHCVHILCRKSHTGIADFSVSWGQCSVSLTEWAPFLEFLNFIASRKRVTQTLEKTLSTLCLLNLSISISTEKVYVRFWLTVNFFTNFLLSLTHFSHSFRKQGFRYLWSVLVFVTISLWETWHCTVGIFSICSCLVVPSERGFLI